MSQYQSFFNEEEAARSMGRETHAAQHAKDTQTASTAARRRDQRTLDGLWDTVNTEAGPAFRMKIKRDDRKNRRLRILKLDPYHDDNQSEVQSKLLILICTYVPALFIDIFVLASTTAAFVGMTMGSVSVAFLYFAQVVFPMSLIMLETSIALRRFRALERGEVGRARVWTLAGGIVVLYLLSAATATYLAAQDFEFASTLDIIWISLLGFAFVSVSGLLHGVILLSGKDVFEAKTHAFDMIGRRWVLRLDQKYRTLAEKTLAPCRSALYASVVFKETHGVSPAPPLLSQAARIVINDAMGGDVVPRYAAPPSFSPSSDDVRSDTDAPNS